jgi:hypothetical protein
VGRAGKAKLVLRAIDEAGAEVERLTIQRAA